MKAIGAYPDVRLRRNRKKDWSRRLVQENNLSSNDLIWPIFITDGKNIKEPIKSMPGVYRYSLDKIEKLVENAIRKKIPMISIFPWRVLSGSCLSMIRYRERERERERERKLAQAKTGPVTHSLLSPVKCSLLLRVMWHSPILLPALQQKPLGLLSRLLQLADSLGREPEEAPQVPARQQEPRSVRSGGLRFVCRQV